MMEAQTQALSTILIPQEFGPYRVIRKIGSGGTSVVFNVMRKKDKEYFAAKVTSRKDLMNQGIFLSFEQELRVHQSLNHPNIAKLDDIVYDKENIYAVMEFCHNGDLYEWSMQGIFENFVLLRKTIFQMLSAVAYLHSRDIAHMDLKPENILLDRDFNVKITDFGCCETNVPKASGDFFGTLYYSAPEVLTGCIDDMKKADVWSLGVIFYSMATGELPWTTGSQEHIRKQILSGNYPHPGDISPSLASLICQCLSLNPAERPSPAEILEYPIFIPETKCNTFPRLKKPNQIIRPGKQIRNSLSIAKVGTPKIVRPQNIVAKTSIASSFSNTTMFTPKSVLC